MPGMEWTPHTIAMLWKALALVGIWMLGCFVYGLMTGRDLWDDMQINAPDQTKTPERPETEVDRLPR
jgi:hypothetical protein